MEEQKLSKGELDKKTLSGDLSRLSYEELAGSIQKDREITHFRPSGVCRVDPRDNTRVVYSMARARRPHDTKKDVLSPPFAQPCPVCLGKTTTAIDVAPLKKGYTFINKNLFPILYPEPCREERGFTSVPFSPAAEQWPAYGLHFLQWNSTYHHPDLHNMDPEDIEIVLQRLALLECKLLHEEMGSLEDSLHSNLPSVPCSEPPPSHNHRGYVGIIKNYGGLVGGSLIHGHQQIVHTNIIPKKIADDCAFLSRNGFSFSSFLLKENPNHLTIKSYNDKIKAVVPFFMRRPLDIILLLEDCEKSYLHDFNGKELKALAVSLREITEAVKVLMEEMGRVFTYNFIFHNGPVGGFYVEILPYTQETGGYEHLGIYLCQSTPSHASNQYKAVVPIVKGISHKKRR